VKPLSRPKKPLRRWIAIFKIELDRYTNEEETESVRVYAGVNVAGIARSAAAFVRNVRLDIKMNWNGVILDYESLRILDDELASTVNDKVLRKQIKQLNEHHNVRYGTFFYCDLDAPES